MLLNWVVKRGFAEVYLGKRTPHLHLRDVRDVLGHDDRFFDLLIFRHQAVQEVDLAVRVDELPMWIGRFRRHEIIGEREGTLTVLRRVCNKALFCFCALERSTLVGVLGKAACYSDDQRG